MSSESLVFSYQKSDKAELERDLKVLNEKLSSAREAPSGQGKAEEAEAILLKQELGKALQQKVAGEERLIHLEGALRECMQQLRLVRKEHHDAVTKTSRESERKRFVFEEKITENNKRLVKLDAENSQLRKALLTKEKVIEDLNEQRVRTEADFNALMIRLESKEKENSSSKYEVRVLEKELEIRNEEREFNRRTADVAHKQHLESVKKIAKLESECQRLRLLVRKRLPGPAAFAKMMTEVEMLGRDPAETRRRKSNPYTTGSMDFSVDNIPDTPTKRINFLTEQLCVVEEENKALKETLIKRTDELQFSRIMPTRISSKLSSRHEFSLGSMSEIGSDDRVSCSESWPSGLMLELEHLRNGKQTGKSSCRTAGASDINLMDDFIEMEKLAILSTDKPCGISHLSSENNAAADGPLQNCSGGHSLEADGSEIIPVSVGRWGLSVSDQELESRNLSIDAVPNWLDGIVKVILEQTRVTKRNPDKLLENIKVALAHKNHPHPDESLDVSENSNHCAASKPPHASGYISRKSLDNSSRMDSPDRVARDHASSAKISQQIQSNLSEPILKTIELIEGISLPSPEYGIKDTLSGMDDSFPSFANSQTPTGYMVRVFQWKTSELSDVLQQFVQTCNDLLNGKADLERFSKELNSALEWIMNHCFSLQDVSSMRYAIKKQFDWDESISESEVEGGMSSQLLEEDRLHAPQDQLENMEFAKKDLVGRLQSETDKSVQLERVTKKEIPKHGMEEEEKQLQTGPEITTASEKLAECQETILNLGKQLKALTSPGDTALFDKVVSVPTDTIATTATPKKNMNQRSSLQDKMLAEDDGESRDLRFPKTKEVICTSKSPTLLDGNSYSVFGLNGAVDLPNKFPNSNGIKARDSEAGIDCLAIVPCRKKGRGGLLKKLFWRRKKDHSKRTPCLCRT